MSDWITLSITDVYDYLAADQADALRTEALGGGQADPLPAIIADVAARIRSEIAGHAPNSLSPTSGAVPPELRGAALALIVEAAQARLPSLEMSDDQVRLANAARALLKRVADGEVFVTPGGGSARTVVVRSRRRFATGSTLIGL